MKKLLFVSLLSGCFLVSTNQVYAEENNLINGFEESQIVSDEESMSIENDAEFELGEVFLEQESQDNNFKESQIVSDEESMSIENDAEFELGEVFLEQESQDNNFEESQIVSDEESVSIENDAEFELETVSEENNSNLSEIQHSEDVAKESSNSIEKSNYSYRSDTYNGGLRTGIRRSYYHYPPSTIYYTEYQYGERFGGTLYLQYAYFYQGKYYGSYAGYIARGW